jgi:hypothetical protein
MRWNNSVKSAKKEKEVAPVFDPCSFDENAMEREFMVTALSA